MFKNSTGAATFSSIHYSTQRKFVNIDSGPQL